MTFKVKCASILCPSAIATMSWQAMHSCGRKLSLSTASEHSLHLNVSQCSENGSMMPQKTLRATAGSVTHLRLTCRTDHRKTLNQRLFVCLMNAVIWWFKPESRLYWWHNWSCSVHHWPCCHMVLPSGSLFPYSDLDLYAGGVGAQTLCTKHDWMLCHATLYHSWPTVPIHWTWPIPHATNHFHLPVVFLELAGVSNASGCTADSACNKRLVSIHKSHHMNSLQITTHTGTWSTSSLVGNPNFCAQSGKYNALWQTNQTTNARTLTSLILLACSTCRCGAQLINTTSKKASLLIDSTRCSNTISSVLQ